jgi:hypothetical protein
MSLALKCTFFEFLMFYGPQTNLFSGSFTYYKATLCYTLETVHPNLQIQIAQLQKHVNWAFRYSYCDLNQFTIDN